MDKARSRPFIWPSWLSKLLSGEARCWYAGWYKAHFKYDKTPDPACDACRDGGKGGACLDPEGCRVSFFREYQEKHDALVNKREKELLAEGYVTRKEDDASFKVSGASADLAGKLDLVGIRNGTARIVDGKSGRQRESDHWQVLLYMFATTMPGSWLEGMEVSGEIAYKHGNVPVRSVGDVERNHIVEAIRKVAQKDAPTASPSEKECRYCDVGSCVYRAHPTDGDATRYF